MRIPAESLCCYQSNVKKIVRFAEKIRVVNLSAQQTNQPVLWWLFLCTQELNLLFWLNPQVIVSKRNRTKTYTKLYSRLGHKYCNCWYHWPCWWTVRMGMFGVLPKRVTCIWCSWKLARLVQRKLLSRSTDYKSITFQVLKLTNKCKLEYLPQRLGKSFLYTRCNVMGNEVWLCFGQQGHHSCATWTREKIR